MRHASRHRPRQGRLPLPLLKIVRLRRKAIAMNPTDPVEWYMEIPIVSRAYLTGAFLTTAACALDVVSPFSLYYNYNAIFFEGEVWRLATNFFFFGMFGIDFIFHMFFLMRYCRLLEENSFRGRTADFICMIAFWRHHYEYTGSIYKCTF